ncbi:MAG TPA: hypothetical protein VHR45_09475 [Thermoanaerobaculia bacterium]|nr:hypothetical protein [Thermoanaerobaculia bacterium]
MQLIFWGSAWNGEASSTKDGVVVAAGQILTGPYMTGLAQYRGVGMGSLVGNLVVAATEPPSPFSDTDVEGMISEQIANGSLPGPETDDQLLYLVVMPSGVQSAGSFVGEHSFFSPGAGGVRAHYGWVTHDGTIDNLTTILSHEIVESATDPEGTAILGVAGTCQQEGWCEIGDVCSSTGVVNGVTVQSYWSQQDQACIIPGS